MTQAFQIGDIVRTKKTGKRCVITCVYTSHSGSIIHEGYEYDAPGIPPGTTRNDIPHSLCPDLSTYAENLILEVLSPWRHVLVDGRPIPIVGDAPHTAGCVHWLLGVINVDGHTVTSGTVPPRAFTTF